MNRCSILMAPFAPRLRALKAFALAISHEPTLAHLQQPTYTTSSWRIYNRDNAVRHLSGSGYNLIRRTAHSIWYACLSGELWSSVIFQDLPRLGHPPAFVNSAKV